MSLENPTVDELAGWISTGDYSSLDAEAADGQYSLEPAADGSLALVDTGPIQTSTNENPVEVPNTFESTQGALNTLLEAARASGRVGQVINQGAADVTKGIPRATGVYGSGTDIVPQNLQTPTGVLMLVIGVAIIYFFVIRG